MDTGMRFDTLFIFTIMYNFFYFYIKRQIVFKTSDLHYSRFKPKERELRETLY